MPFPPLFSFPNIDIILCPCWKRWKALGKKNNLNLLFEKCIVFLCVCSPPDHPTSWVSKIIRKMFAPSRFWTLDTKISWSKGHFVFLWVNMHGAKWNCLYTVYTPHVMDTEIVSIILKKATIFLHLLFSYSIYKLSLAHRHICSLYMAQRHTVVLSRWLFSSLCED